MHVIIYVLDALRADHLSCYGYDRKTSPNIDTLAAEGVLFENCFTSTTWTRPVAASILTGVYPGIHLTRSRQDTFSSNLARLPEVLKVGGFKTAAFSTMGNIAQDIGFGRGFDRYYDLFRIPEILNKRRKLDAAEEGLMQALDQEIALPRAEDVHDYLFPWLGEQRNADTFNFIWSIETHVPYKAPEEFRRFSSTTRPSDGERTDIRRAEAADRQRLIDLYDDEIFYNDHCIGQIIDCLKGLRVYDDAMVIIVSDHGDAFYEHSFYAHGHTPYEELIHVPMVVKFPDGEYVGQRVEGLTELVDIFPTVAAVTGLLDCNAEWSSFVQGHNLIPLLEGERSRVRDYVFSDTQSLEVHNRYLSVRNHRWKYIKIEGPKRNSRTFVLALKHILKRRIVFSILRNLRHFLRTYFAQTNEYLFDLSTDPAEQTNLVSERPELADHFREMLRNWREENAELAALVSGVAYTYEESEILREHLERLGYL
jgi:arylsulfatase A-like enzyme